MVASPRPPRTTSSGSRETTSGSCEGEYLMQRIWTAYDTCGNSVSHTQIITVTDTTAPEIAGNFDQFIDANCDAIPEVPELEFQDACSEVMDITFNEESTQGYMDCINSFGI